MNAYISRILLGGAVLLVGVLLLIEALNIADTGAILRTWWPLLIILGGVAMFVSDTKNYLWALVVITIGVFAQLRALGYYSEINPWQLFWPLVLIAFGASILLKRPNAQIRDVDTNSDDITAILGGSDHRNVSDDFAGSKVTAILGGAKIDLRKARIKKVATIEIFTFMGGVELIVPRNVMVKNQANVILGGVENKTDQEVTKNAPTLVLIGDVILGGVEIKN